MSSLSCGAKAERDNVIGALPVEIVVAVHDALRAVRRARRIHEAEEVVGLGCVHWRGSCRPGEACAVALRRLLEEDDVANSFRRGCGKLRIAKQKARAGVIEDVAHLVGREAIVDRQRHGADVARRKRQLDERRAVFHQQRDHVAGADALRHQPAGRSLDAGHQLGVGGARARVEHGGPLRGAPGMEADEARQTDHAAAFSRLPARCRSQTWAGSHRRSTRAMPASGLSYVPACGTSRGAQGALSSAHPDSLAMARLPGMRNSMGYASSGGDRRAWRSWLPQACPDQSIYWAAR